MIKRPLFLLAFALLALGGWLVVRSFAPGPVAGDPAAPSAARRPAPPPPSRPAPVPVLVRKLSDPALPATERINAVRELPADLSERESTALIDLLHQPAPAGIGPSTWHMLLNEIMEVLRQPRFQWTGYGPAMISLMTDRHLDPVIRDYAAQHLALYLSGDAARRAPGSLPAGMEAFLTVLRGEREAAEPVTGTILMALCALRSKRPAADFAPYDEPLATAVIGLLSGERHASLSNRISAIQTAGRMNIRAALPLIRGYARDGAPDPSLRLSSIAALGYYADPADKPFLQQLAAGTDALRHAAKTALQNHRAAPTDNPEP